MRSFALSLLIAVLSVSTLFGFELQEVEAPKDQLLKDSLEYAEKLRQDTTKTEGLQDTLSADTLDYQAVSLSYNHQEKTFSLVDKALLTYRGAKLTADTIFFNNKTMLLNAYGDPEITDGPTDKLHGYRMRYNIKKRVGQIYYGTTFRDEQFVNGMSIRRLPDGRLQVSRGDFSTCTDIHHQHYYFYTRRFSTKQNEKIVAAPVVMNIQDVPIAVLPLMVSPLSKEASSGLLIPTPGGDQAQGMFLRGLGFYWAINEYMDLTIKTDIVEGPEGTFPENDISMAYNYMLLYHLSGGIDIKWDFKTSAGSTYPYELEGWDLKFNHKQNITPDKKMTLSGSGSFISKTSLRRDNALDHETKLDQQANANMAFRKVFKNNSTLTVEARQNKTLYDEDRLNTTTRNLPGIKYSISGNFYEADEDDLLDTLYEEKWYEKLRYSYSINAIYDQKLEEEWNPDTLDLFDPSAVDTTKTKIETDTIGLGYTHSFTLNYSGKLFDVITITPAFKYDGYWSAYSYDNPHDSLDRSKSFNKDLSKGEFGDYYSKYNVSLTASTKLYGIWKPEIGRFVGVRHILDPSIGVSFHPKLDTNYTFVSNKAARGPLFQNRRYSINLGLKNDFDMKYLRIKESQFQQSSVADETDEPQSNYEEKERKIVTTSANTSYNFAADSLHWSAISSSVGLQITESKVFRVSLRHSVYDSSSATPNKAILPYLTSMSFSLNKSFSWSGNFNDGFTSKKYVYTAAPWDARFSYSYGYKRTRSSLSSPWKEDINHSLSGFSLNIRPTKDWNVNYTTNYDFKNAEFSRHQFRLSRNLHRWQLDFTWTPVGPSEGWSLKIWLKDMPDLKYEASNKDVRSPDVWNAIN
ncbi:MAG: putative LPS assembly protein LptD [Fibrobacterales bacterium]